MSTQWTGGNGLWQVATNWTNGAPTTPAIQAVISAPGHYTVAVRKGYEYHVGSVLLNGSEATLAVAGILDITHTLQVSRGTLVLSGTLHGATVAAAGGKIIFANGTLDGVTYRGPLDLSTVTANLTVTNGLTLAGKTGTGLLTLGGSSQLSFAGDQTLAGGMVSIAGGTIDISGTLTIGSTATVRYQSAQNVFGKGGSITNDGAFNVANGSVLSIGGEFSNINALTVSGGTFSAGSFSNAGTATLIVQAGSVFKARGFFNAGTLTADQATVDLSLTSGPIGTLKIDNSQVTLKGVGDANTVKSVIAMLSGHHNVLTLGLSIDNTGATLNLPGASGFDKFIYDGTISGGTVRIGGAFSGALSGLTVKGALNAADGATLKNVTFQSASGTGPDLVNLTGTLTLGAGETYSTFDNAKLVAANGSTFNAPGYLTVGSRATVKALGDFTLLNALGFDQYSGMINNGTLDAAGGPGTTFTLSAYSFQNNGTIRVEAGGKFVVKVFNGAFLTKGTYDIGANASLTGIAFANTTLSLNVIYEGTGASFLPDGLTAIGKMGSLTLKNGATLNVASHFEIDGSLRLVRGSFSTDSITVAAGGVLSGSGTVLATVENDGTINAAGRTLTITQHVTGAGQATIEKSARLEFGSDVAAGQTVLFKGNSGALALDYAQGFAGTIAGFAPGNVIDLVNTKANATSYSAAKQTLTIKENNTVVATLKLSGNYAGDTFTLASDGNGGTEIEVAAKAARIHRFIEAVAASAPPGAVSPIAPPTSDQTNAAIAARPVGHFGHS
jgi:hypothetical protein